MINTVTAREKRPQGGSIMSIRNLEYKAKERRSKLQQRRWSYNLACSHVKHHVKPWLQSLQSCNIKDHYCNPLCVAIESKGSYRTPNGCKLISVSFAYTKSRVTFEIDVYHSSV